MQNSTKASISRLNSRFLTFLSVILFSLFSNAYGQLVWSGESSTETFSATSAWWTSTEVPAHPWMISIDNAFTFNGGSAWRFESRTGDHGPFDDSTGANAKWRSQIAQGNPPNNETPAVRQYMEGNEFYYGFAVYFDPTYPDNRDWNQFAQWKTVAPSGWPEVELDINNYTPGQPQNVTVKNNQANSDGSGSLLRQWTLHPFTKGVWHKYVVHIRHHHIDGFIEIWHGVDDGPMTLVLPRQINLDTHNETNRPGHMGTGIYRAPNTTVPAIMWADAYKAGTTYDDVVPTRTANTPPTVNITSPSNGATFTAPASVEINASASDADGSVSKVEFYNGTTLMGTDFSSPYSYAYNNVPTGYYKFTAKAYDNRGAIITSTAVSITVNCKKPGNLVNTSFAEQTGLFTSEFDVTPTSANLNEVIGLSNGPACDHTDLACVLHFGPDGFIDALNGSGYGSDSTIPYSAGISYHVKMLVNLSTKKYDIYVTPRGQSKIIVGLNYAFRTQQNGATQLNNWGKTIKKPKKHKEPTSNLTVTNFTTTAIVCGTTDNFLNTSFTDQTGTFTTNFDVVATGNTLNGVVGLSNGAATDYPNLACIIRFNLTGQIDARNGSVYSAATTIPYYAGRKYHIKMYVYMSTKKYDIYVTPEGGSQITLGTNYGFRTEQIGVTQLNNYSKATTTCNMLVTNFTAVTGIFRTSTSSSEVKGLSINSPVKASISFPGSEKAIKVYPNPGKGYIFVDAHVKRHSRVQMSIFDINGKLIWIRSYANSAEYLNERINVGNFVPGSYTLKFQENGSVTSKKLIIE